MLRTRARYVTEHLDPFAEHDEAEHHGKRREGEHDHSKSQHVSPYDRSHAAANKSSVTAAITQPAADHGHTGASIYGLSRSMLRRYGGSA